MRLTSPSDVTLDLVTRRLTPSRSSVHVAASTSDATSDRSSDLGRTEYDMSRSHDARVVRLAFSVWKFMMKVAQL